MANIIFYTASSPNQELDEKIRMARDVFKGLLENNEKLKAFDALITITNKNEENLTKFILKEVDPKSKYNEVLIFLNTYFSEYMGG